MGGIIERLEKVITSISHSPVALQGTDIKGNQVQYSYPQLIDQIDRCAKALTSLDCQVVALHGGNSVNWVIMDLACQQAGIVCIPIPTFFSAEQISRCITHSGTQLIMSADKMLHEQLDHESEIELTALESSEALACFTVSRVEKPNSPELPQATQKITFTSGSTGSPKGVCLSLEHQWQVAKSLAAVIDICSPKHLCLLPLSTLLENIAGVMAPLLSGGTVVVKNDQERGMLGSSKLDSQALLSCIDSAQPTSMILIPELLSMLVTAMGMGWRPPETLQILAVGGGKVDARLLATAHDMGLPVYQGYGLSECGSVVALNTPYDSHGESVGRVLPHCKVNIEDGEIAVTGASCLGYLGDKTSWYQDKIYSGDIGELNDGFLSVAGRKKNVLISSYGRNINPEWVESVLMSKPLLNRCIVLGDGRPFLVAIVTAIESIPNAQIQAWLESINTTLPDYAQIKSWLRVSDSELTSLYTLNGRPKRVKIQTHFHDQINALYESETSVPAGGKPMNFYEKLKAETQQQQQYLLSAPLIQRALAGDITLNDYVAFLQQAYHHVKHTTPLLMATGSRLPSEKEWLRNAVAEYIEEELGHQEWILNDIEACGFNKEKVRVSAPNLSTELMVSYAYDTVARINPLGFFGMVHVLEGTSINLADMAADKIQTTLNLPIKAFSYLRSHGKLDQDHVKFFEDLMNQITDPVEQNVIIHACKAFYILYGNIFRELSPEQALAVAA